MMSYLPISSFWFWQIQLMYVFAWQLIALDMQGDFSKLDPPNYIIFYIWRSGFAPRRGGTAW